MSQGTAQPLLKGDEEDRDFDSLVRRAIGVTAAIAFEQSMSAQLAQVVAQLIQPVTGRGQGVGSENGLINLGDAPAGEAGCRRAARLPLNGSCGCHES